MKTKISECKKIVNENKNRFLNILRNNDGNQLLKMS